LSETVPEDPAKITNLVVHFRWLCHGFRDFVTKEAAVPLPEAVHEALHGRRGYSQSVG
jgi:hypothetical protein